MMSAKMERSDAASVIWDVIVIGAGPAGALAAVCLAKSGLRTLLVERRSFPRIKVCGGCINGRSVKILDSVGLGNLLPSLPARPVSQLRLRCAHRSLTLPLPGGWAISRGLFDAALANEAAKAGAMFLDGVSAQVATPAGLDGSDSAAVRGVHLRDHAGAASMILGRVIVAADGLGHPALRKLPEFRCHVASKSRIGVGAVFEDSSPRYSSGAIHMVVGRAGYVGLVRVEDNLLNLAAAIDPNSLRERTGPARAVGRILKESGFPVPDRLDQVAWQGTVSLTRATPRAVGRRILVIGDAAGYVEPFTGEGVACALTDGAAVPRFVHRGIENWSEVIENDWIAERRKNVVRRQWLCRTLAGVLRSPTLVQALMGFSVRFPWLAEGAVRRVNAIPSAFQAEHP